MENDTVYRSKTRSILGAIQQGGRYYWAIDTPCPQALKDLIAQGIITFKGKIGILAEYIPLVKEHLGFQLKQTGNVQTTART